jgi:hypothetical protein
MRRRRRPINCQGNAVYHYKEVMASRGIFMLRNLAERKKSTT